MPEAGSLRLEAGDMLAGKYRVERTLGEGGVGIVVAAWHTELRTRVAIKLLRPSLTASEEAVKRFSREARAASTLRSEHVVRVFDVGKLPDGTPYMVMEHLEGQDLAGTLAAHGPMSAAEAVGYVLQACEGVAEAHSVGIVHRDLKPTNLFLTQSVDGRSLVKVLDFGIAKQAELELEGALTGSFTVVGSPQYMSPEQMRSSGSVDVRSDIWSLGVCLYELLTSAVPFDGPTVMDICSNVMTRSTRSPDSLRSEVPARLAAVVMRCLEKEPERRYPDLAALADALEEFVPEAERGAAARVRRVLRRPTAPAKQPGAPRDSSRSAHATLALPRLYDSGASPTSPSPRRRRTLRLALLTVAGVAVAAGATVLIAARRGRSTGSNSAPVTGLPEGPVVAAQTIDASLAEAPPLLPPSPDPSPQATTAPIPSQPRRLVGPAEKSRAAASFVPAPVASTSPAPPSPTAELRAPVSPPQAAAPPPPPPRFDLAAAHVEVGSAIHTVGTTAVNVNRTIAPLAGRMTTCYRNALPQLTGPVDGTGTLHVETDDDGVITNARLTSAVGLAVERCIAATARGLQVPNVDTGRARADVPVVFKAR
jgi:eukaryotic-like serine/threonine-protein kinase